MCWPHAMRRVRRVTAHINGGCNAISTAVRARMDPFIDRRQHPRDRTCIVATVVQEDGLSRWPATIINLTPAGAMLELGDATLLPEQFNLLFARTIQPCHLAWSTGSFAGLRFVTT